MKKAIAVVLGMVIFQFLAAPLFAREINVGLELFPPLISEDGKGLSIDLLRAVENISDLEFKIVIVPYNRAKKELETGKRELIGHTPTGLETKDFYKYAQELTWFIPSVLDIYAMTETNLDQQRFAKLKRIGTPHGNEHFFSALYTIPIECFYTSHLKNLLRMLEKGRLEMIIFARASTMTMVKKLKISKVYYRKLDSIPAGFAVRLDKNGTQLKTKLDGLIQKVDHHKIFKDYNHYLQLPDKGIVTLTK